MLNAGSGLGREKDVCLEKNNLRVYVGQVPTMYSRNADCIGHAGWHHPSTVRGLLLHSSEVP